MRLIGQLDSPYVRRVAISLQLLGHRFSHDPLSVFRNFDAIARINPVVKVPTLVCDDGTVLLDSTLILQHLEALPRTGRSLVPTALPAMAQDLRLTGLALAVCEKAVSLVYEHILRPEERRHAPWIARVTGQLQAACDELERLCAAGAPSAAADRITQGGLTAAVAWTFTQRMLDGLVPVPTGCPALAAFTAQAEALPAFLAAPYGESVCAAAQ